MNNQRLDEINNRLIELEIKDKQRKLNYFGIIFTCLSVSTAIFSLVIAFSVRAVSHKQIAVDILYKFNIFLDEHPETSDCLQFINHFNQDTANEILHFRKSKFTIKFQQSNNIKPDQITQIKITSDICLTDSNKEIKKYELVTNQKGATIGITIFPKGLEIIQSRITRYLNILELIASVSQFNRSGSEILDIQVINPLIKTTDYNDIISKSVKGISAPEEKKVSGYPCLEKILKLPIKENHCDFYWYSEILNLLKRDSSRKKPTN